MDPKLLAVRRRLRDDFAFYAPNALKIRTKDGEIVPFRMNKAQAILHQMVEDQKARTGFVRAIILKARQMGSSTYVGGRQYSGASQASGQRALVVTHHADSTRALFDMTKLYHDECPEILKPETKYSSRKELQFSKLRSGYVVATAGGDGIARGETFTRAHLSEMAFWPKSTAAANYNGLMQAISKSPGTEVFIESTANGMSGLFYDQWKAAVAGKTDFIPVFLPWFIQDEYRETVPSDFERTPSEIKLVAQFGLDDEQLCFRRKKIADHGIPFWQQEYPSTADEAFMTSGRPVFNAERVTALLEAKRVPLAKMGMEGNGFVKDPHGELLCYLPHDPKETYYIGADVGAGVQRDWSVAQVFDSQRRQAGVYRAQVDPDAFGTVLWRLGKFYNNAQIICERNNHGILTNRVLHKDHEYQHVYTETIFDKITDTETTTVGFFTSEKSKPLVIDKLRARVRLREIEIYDEDTINEMRSFIVTPSGRMEAESGCHDDTVMALALCDHINDGAWTPILNQDDWFVDYD